MVLTVFDRLILLNILQIEGDITTLRILRELKEALSFSEEEHKVLEFRQEVDKMVWKSDADVNKDFTIGDVAKDIIKKRLQELSDKKKLREEHIPLFEKFVEGNNGS
jgi:hypothetical protein